MNKHIDYFHKQRKPRTHNPTFLSFDFSLAVHPLDIPNKLSYIDSSDNSSFLSQTPQPPKTKEPSTLSTYGNSILTPIRTNKDQYEDQEPKNFNSVRSHLPKQYKNSVSNIFHNRPTEDSMFAKPIRAKQNLEQNSNFGYYHGSPRAAGLRAQYFDQLTHLH